LRTRNYRGDYANTVAMPLPVQQMVRLNGLMVDLKNIQFIGLMLLEKFTVIIVVNLSLGQILPDRLLE